MGKPMSKRKKHKNNPARKFIAVLAALCVCGAAILVYLACGELGERRTGESYYASLVAGRDNARPADERVEAQKDVIEAVMRQQQAREASPEAYEVSEELSAHFAEGEPVTSDAAEASQGNESANAETIAGPDVREFSQEDFWRLLDELTIRPSSMDFAPVVETCPDLVGWLRIDDTVIDYPIVQGANNEYYLHHLADKTPNSNGAIMMAAGNDALWRDMITTLHGHHMRSGAMFGDLSEYSKEGYYEMHPVAKVYTPLGDYEARIFAACVVNPAEFHYPMNLPEEEFNAMVEQFRKSSPFVSDVDVSYGDRLLLLSTCEYTFPNARYVVMAKLVPWSGEEESGADERP